MSKYKVCFMGTPKLAQTVLEALVTSGEYDVVLCCCQPDKPVGRKKIITPPPTKVYATSMGIECFQPDSMRTDEAYEKIKACELATEAGADFVKTSTGFGKGGATAHDVRLMKEHIAPNMQVKASTGINSRATCDEMIEAGATRLGTSSGVKIIEEMKEAGIR